MTSIVRETHIDAAPETVRRHITDPERRRRWLDDDPVAPSITSDGLTYTRGEGEDASRVHIAVLPDGAGSRVRVTEEIGSVREAGAPSEGPARGETAEAPAEATRKARFRAAGADAEVCPSWRDVPDRRVDSGLDGAAAVPGDAPRLLARAA